MGQYYTIYTKNKNGEKIYDTVVNKEFVGAKLMEHSWWLNDFVGSICKKIYKTPTTVAWVGDYSRNETYDEIEARSNHLSDEKITFFYEKCYGSDGLHSIHKDVLYLDNKFLCDHTKKIFISGNRYKKGSNNNDWLIHPMPLLTSIGNGLGGGDYLFPTDDSTEELVGSWAGDTISIEDTPPKDFTEINVIFKEG